MKELLRVPCPLSFYTQYIIHTKVNSLRFIIKFRLRERVYGISRDFLGTLHPNRNESKTCTPLTQRSLQFIELVPMRQINHRFGSYFGSRGLKVKSWKQEYHRIRYSRKLRNTSGITVYDLRSIWMHSTNNNVDIFDVLRVDR